MRFTEKLLSVDIDLNSVDRSFGDILQRTGLPDDRSKNVDYINFLLIFCF